MLKVFVKNEELTKPTPTVMASYDEATTVPEGAHGENVVNFLVQDQFLKISDDIPPRQYLIEGWRTADTALEINPVMRAEAQRRINAVFSPEQRIASVHELVEMLLKYGLDPAKWPNDAVARRGQIERLWNYVRDVNERAKSHKMVPTDPTNNSNWPTRIT